MFVKYVFSCIDKRADLFLPCAEHSNEPLNTKNVPVWTDTFFMSHFHCTVVRSMHALLCYTTTSTTLLSILQLIRSMLACLHQLIM